MMNISHCKGPQKVHHAQAQPPDTIATAGSTSKKKVVESSLQAAYQDNILMPTKHHTLETSKHLFESYFALPKQLSRLT
jgi:hypothetical protein